MTPGTEGSGGGSTDFRFRTVPEEAKASLVRGVFDFVAPRYDLMSLDLHRAWKALLMEAVCPRLGPAHLPALPSQKAG